MIQNVRKNVKLPQTFGLVKAFHHLIGLVNGSRSLRREGSPPDGAGRLDSWGRDNTGLVSVARLINEGNGKVTDEPTFGSGGEGTM